MERGKLDVKLKWNRDKEGTEEGFKLIGRVISKTKVGLGIVRDSVAAAWKVEGNLDVKMIGFNLFSFTFKLEKEANRILRDSPWVVRNYMLSLQKRKPYLSDNEIQINTCVFWVQFHNIPREGRLASNIELMANVVGRVIEIENPEDKRFRSRSFGRARVEIDVEKPLVPGFSAPRPDENLEDIWIQAKYEKLIRFCYKCGKLGHESKGCEEEIVEFMVNDNLKGYDAGLCAQVFRLPAVSQGSWNSGKSTEEGLVHGEGKCNKCLHEGEGSRYGGYGKGKEMDKSRERIASKSLSQPMTSEAKRKEGKEMPSQFENPFKHSFQVGPVHGVGRTGALDQQSDNSINYGLGWKFNENNRLNSLLKARQERLSRTQAKYWVELVEDEDEGAHESNAIVPVQSMEIGELTQSIQEVSLKRKLDEEDEAPLAKRRKDHHQESPRSANERERAVAGLRKIAKEDGSQNFNFKFEGDLNFQLGDGSKVQNRGRKKVKRGLFNKPGETEGIEFTVRAEAFRYGQDVEVGTETCKESTDMLEGCGG